MDHSVRNCPLELGRSGSDRLALRRLDRPFVPFARLHVDKDGRLALRPVNRQRKHIETIVVADDIVKLLRFDALRDVNIGICDTFAV